MGKNKNNTRAVPPPRVARQQQAPDNRSNPPVLPVEPAHPEPSEYTLEDALEAMHALEPEDKRELLNHLVTSLQPEQDAEEMLPEDIADAVADANSLRELPPAAWVIAVLAKIVGGTTDAEDLRPITIDYLAGRSGAAQDRIRGAAKLAASEMMQALGRISATL